MSSQPDPFADAPDFDGLRVQAPGAHQIWLVFGGQRHYITGLDVMRSLFRDDAFLADAECEHLPEGSVLGPGSRLVRAGAGTSVYLVVSSGTGQEIRHRVVDAAQFERYGFDPDKVTEIPPEALRRIPAGQPLANAPDFDGLRVQAPGAHQIWLVFGGQRHYITGLDVMRSLFRDDAFLADAECEHLPEGSVLGPGSRLVRAGAGTSVYLVVSSGTGQEIRHRVVDAAQFERYGFDPDKVTEIPPEALRRIPAGRPLGPPATTAGLAERENLERLVDGLHPSRPTLLLLLEERDGFAERFAAHIQETAQRRVNVLVGWLEPGQLVVSSGPAGTPNAVTARLPEMGLLSLARALRIGRIDGLATRFSLQLQTVLEAFDTPFDLTPMIVPPARDEANGVIQILARKAARVIACGDAMLSALRAGLPGYTIVIGLDPEARKPNLFRVHPARLDPGEDLRVLIWNATAEPENGLVAETVATGRDASLTVRFFGLDGRPAAVPAGLRDLGPADSFDLNALVCVLRPHLVWFPGPAQDAFDFRVSAALAQGLPILASAACGFGLRLANRPYTWILPADATAAAVRTELAAIRRRWDAEYGGLRRTEPPPNFYPSAYLSWARPDAPSQVDPMPGEAADLVQTPFPAPAAPAPMPAEKKWRLFP